jgi:hypothetical protein
MAHEDLINRMIQTYRDLNLLLRPVSDTVLNQRAGGQPSVRDHIQRLRDTELRFTQTTKEILTGQTIPEELGDDATPILGLEHEGDPTRVLLSQFGTARESGLAMLREMTDEQWTAAGHNGRTMVERIQRLIQNDEQVLQTVRGMLDAAPAGARS